MAYEPPVGFVMPATVNAVCWLLFGGDTIHPASVACQVVVVACNHHNKKPRVCGLKGVRLRDTIYGSPLAAPIGCRVRDGRLGRPAFVGDAHTPG